MILQVLSVTLQLLLQFFPANLQPEMAKDDPLFAPRSHISPASMTPLPHCDIVLLTSLQDMHCSPGTFALEVSHSSSPSSLPFPHTDHVATWHSTQLDHAGKVLAQSHPSPGCTIPSQQLGKSLCTLQAMHLSQAPNTPSSVSHSSPRFGSVRPL